MRQNHLPLARPSRSIPPLPHPSWQGEASPRRSRALSAAEFWDRLGL